MPQSATLVTIEQDWAENFGCDLAHLRAPGITLLANAGDFADYVGAYLLRWDGGSAVFTVPAPLRDQVAAAIADRGADEVFDRAFLAAAFGERVDRIIGPASRNYADASTFRPVDSRGARVLAEQDAAALRRLAAVCGPEQWAEGGIDFNRPPHFGCFIGEELAAAGMLSHHGSSPHGPLRNISIVTHPAYRRQGYGRAVVSAMTAHTLAQGAIPHYQALVTNTASLALARSLGFVQYATVLAVRLRMA